MTPQIDAAAAHQLVEDLGFLLVPGRPFADGCAYLMISIRRTPTLAHFDPELVDYWATQDGRGMPLEVDSSVPPGRRDFSWGEIHIVDRLGAENIFAAFGGQLEVGRYEDGRVLVFSSEAPIVARGGHSQSWEAEAHEIDAFIAQLRAAAVPRSQLERHLAEVSPVARYAAFIGARLAIGRAAERRVGWRAADRALLNSERRRLRDTNPDEWRDGLELLGQVRQAAGSAS